MASNGVVTTTTGIAHSVVKCQLCKIRVKSGKGQAKNVLFNSFKRSGNKSKDVVKKMVKDKLDQVLTGSGGKKRKSKQIHHHHLKKKVKTLLDM